MNYDLAKELAKEYDVTVLRPVPSRPIGYKYGICPSEELVDGFKLVTIDSFLSPESNIFGRIKESISFSRACKGYLKKSKDTYSFVYNDAWQFFGLFIIAHYCSCKKMPFILPIQDVYPESLLTHLKVSGCFKKLALLFLLPIDKYYQRKAIAVRTITNEMADYLSETRKMPRNKYCVVYNWQDSPDKPILEQNNANRIYAYFGSVNEHANVELIISSFISSGQKDSMLWIYGSGNRLEQCRRIVKEANAKNVVFGEFTPSNMYELQSKTDVLVLALPSGNGNLALPSKLSSYLFSGKPVLASVDSKCTVDGIIRKERCGYVVAPDNLDSLINGFNYFASLGDSELKDMGRRGQKFAYNNLTKEKNLSLVVKMIKKSITE